MRKKLVTAIVAVGATVAATLVGSSPAGADTVLFVGGAGGSYVKVGADTISSALTAESSLNGTTSPARDSNSLAQVSIPNVLTIGGVATSTEIKPIGSGWEIVDQVTTAGVNVLNGLVQAAAITTTTTVSLIDGVAHGTSTSSILGLKIAGAAVPKVIPNNAIIGIPNVATVALNVSIAADSGGFANAIGAGIAVTLLKPRGSQDAGVSVYVASTFAAVSDVVVPPTGHFVTGQAYATKVAANVGDLVNVKSDPTAPIKILPNGTKGVVETNSIAAVNLSPVLRIGAITDSAVATNTTAGASAETTSQIASINLFGGLIQAKAITAVAASSSGSPPQGASTLAGLRIAGKTIPLSVAPNTSINVANLGTITINQQIVAGGLITVRALDIVLGKARSGLPIGAEIQIAVASAGAA